MLVWNDLEADEKIKVYDKGVDITNREGVYDLLVNYRSGDMWAPQLEQIEALRRNSPTSSIASQMNQTPFNDGAAGLRVVKMLEAAKRIAKQERRFVLPLICQYDFANRPQRCTLPALAKEQYDSNDNEHVMDQYVA